MSQFPIYATTGFGIESLVRREIEKIVTGTVRSENGRIRFTGNLRDLFRANLHVRTANRIYIEMARFTALDFDTYFDHIQAIPWCDYIDPDGRITVTGSSQQSKLHHLPTCQAMAKKAIVNSMNRSGVTTLPETGNPFHVHVSIIKDNVTVGLNSSGDGLHRRGYRKDTGIAPLRETLAATLVELSRWSANRPLVDPFCGSGTILIEAALKANHHAPGLHRRFACEEWSWMDTDECEKIRKEGINAVRNMDLDINGFDMDHQVLTAAKANARRAGVQDQIKLTRCAAEKIRLTGGYGCVITNPPYGERSADRETADKMLTILGKLMVANPTWSFFILSAREDMRPQIKQKPSKKRKLYNGKIRCYLHQFFGPLPR